MKPSTNSIKDAGGSLEPSADIYEKMMTAMLEHAKAAQTYWVGLSRSVSDFMAPALMTLNSLAEVKRENFEGFPRQDISSECQGLWESLLQMSEKGLNSGLKSMNDFHLRQMDEAFRAWTNTLFGPRGRRSCRLYDQTGRNVRTFGPWLPPGH